MALRRQRDRPRQRAVLRTLRLALPTTVHQPRAVRAGPDRRPRHLPSRPAVPGTRAGVGARTAAARRTPDDVLARRADRLLLGDPGPHRPPAPRHLVDQLDLPRVRRT